jgi:uncharacterized membrane protein YfcA
MFVPSQIDPLLLLSVLALVALLSGFVNALAGGGAVFPALIIAGFPAIEANATSTIILMPMQLLNAWAMWRVTRDDHVLAQRDARIIYIVSFFGGTVGALLLLMASPTLFSHIAPWLLLLGTLIFAHGTFLPASDRSPVLSPALRPLVHFGVSVYGGFFGGGIGILVLAILRLYGMRDIRAMTRSKALINGLIGLTASTLFVIDGVVLPREAVVMGGAAMLGGWLGMRFGVAIPRRLLEVFVIVTGLCLSAYLLVVAYG